MKSDIKKMIGGDYQFSGAKFTIENIERLKGDIYLVTTNVSDHTVSEEELLKDFSPVVGVHHEENRLELFRMHKSEVADMQNLSAILMGNITKVQEDAKYIDQAKSINESAKQIIELKKTQIDMVKLMKGL